MAGLPNITGSFGDYVVQAELSGPVYHGVFQWPTHSNNLCVALSSASYQKSVSQSDWISFNASRSSTIYGKSSVVTPLSRSTLYILKY